MARKPQTLTVAADGSGTYRQIQAALDAAAPGDTVRVRAGTYTEDLRLRSGVTLVGEGADRTHLVAASGNAMRADNVRDAVVCDLHIDGAGKDGCCAVYINATSASFNRCVISGAGHCGIQAGNRSRLTLRASTARANSQAGVLIHGDSEGLLEGNTLAENGVHGIAVQERGRLTARDNTARGNRGPGVLIRADGEGLLEGNTLADNGLHGIEVRERGHLNLTGNTVIHNAHLGVLVYGEGRAKLRHNIVALNTMAGVRSIGNSGDPPAAEMVLTRNCVWDNHPNYTGELVTSTDLQADPCFVDAEHGDYHLRPDSPCIGAGIDGEDLGAFPFGQPKVPVRAPVAGGLRSQLLTLPLCHVAATDLPPGRLANWLRGAAAAGQALLLGLARDLGLLLSRPAGQWRLARPSYLPFDLDTAPYLALLERVAAHPLVRELASWRPPLPDAALAVVLARLTEGLDLPEPYRLPSGRAGVFFTRALAAALEQADPAQLWRDTPSGERPDWNALLPPAALARVEANLRSLNRDELRLLAQYGPRLGGPADLRELADLLALTGLPEAARLALVQSLQLLPRLGGSHTSGGVQLYPEGGYEGLASRGSLDSLLPTEAAYPRALFLHRVLNGEALYYGRERPPERRRELAFLVAQAGHGLGGDGDVLARALLLALGQVLTGRGHEVLYSFAGTDLTEPRPFGRAGEVARVLYHREAAAANPGRVLRGVLGRLKGWRDDYWARRVLWVLGEHFDADDAEDHEPLYRLLCAEAPQQAWYVRVGRPVPPGDATRPATARYFERWQWLDTARLWEGRNGNGHAP
jgi:parallel beta-helix repeat protein